MLAQPVVLESFGSLEDLVAFVAAPGEALVFGLLVVAHSGFAHGSVVTFVARADDTVVHASRVLTQSRPLSRLEVTFVARISYSLENKTNYYTNRYLYTYVVQCIIIYNPSTYIEDA